jgi:GNAT superfamily N-acetyltransferase
MSATAVTALPSLPPTLAQLRARHYRGRPDHPGLAELWSETLRANGSAERFTVGNADAWLGHPRNMDPFADLVVVEGSGGRLVASAIVQWVDRNLTGERAFETHCDVRPEYRRQGIGGALLAWQATRTADIATSMTDVGERPTIRVGYAMDADPGARVLLEEAGFTAVRRASELLRPDLRDIPEFAAPTGISIGPIDATDETLIRTVWTVGGDVFAGHWGDSLPDRTETGWLRFREDPDCQPELWCVAWDGDEIVGHILNYVAPDDEGVLVGWTEGIAVREPWRRRGIARAMLAWSLRRVRDAGASIAGLGVDLENPNQALTLYESLGFRVSASETEFHLPFRIG